ncbi:TRAP transporter substrate-binding protein [Pseudocolwellia sp. HL-MZ19]|uniref:TRAP transporter substrate-binding protein n=1 Tax=unclassified Pseudocolwellia TaxID=2848178 RepID=UPI003CF5D761
MTLPLKKTSMLIVLLLSLMTISCQKNNQQMISISLAHNSDIQHPIHQALIYFDERLQVISNNTMSLKLYPGEQLGSEREILELIQIGTLGMTKISASSLETFVPQMKIFNLPYLFRNKSHFWQVLNSPLGEELLQNGEKYRIKGLGYFDAGSRSFYTVNKKIESPKDLAGLKIRVMGSKSAVDMVNTMGGASTPVSWGEIYTALQQGIVEGAENNPPSFFYSKHYEVSKYYLLDEHTSIPDVIVVGTHVWNKLNTEQQTWLKQAMKEATVYQRKLWDEATKMALTKVKEAGVMVIEADKSLFESSVSSIYKKIENPELLTLVDNVRLIGDK